MMPRAPQHFSVQQLPWRVLRSGGSAQFFSSFPRSPDDNQIAAGDTSGRIVIWHNLAGAVAAATAAAATPAKPSAGAAAAAGGGGEDGSGGAAAAGQGQQQQQLAPAATVHWHAHAVGCLAFSVDGSYLLSGG